MFLFLKVMSGWHEGSRNLLQCMSLNRKQVVRYKIHFCSGFAHFCLIGHDTHFTNRHGPRVYNSNITYVKSYCPDCVGAIFQEHSKEHFHAVGLNVEIASHE